MGSLSLFATCTNIVKAVCGDGEVKREAIRTADRPLAIRSDRPKTDPGVSASVDGTSVTKTRTENISVCRLLNSS